MEDKDEGFDFEIPTTPGVARAMLHFWKKMKEYGNDKFDCDGHIEFYSALVDALSADLDNGKSLREDVKDADDDARWS